jgi:hypothetical protein
MTEPNLSPRDIAVALGGEFSGKEVRAPGPGHTPKDRSLTVRVDALAPDGFLVHSFAGDDPLACKDYVRDRLGIRPERERQPASASIIRMQERVSSKVSAGSSPAEYVYRAADGTPYLRVKRTSEKQFYQQHWNGSSWVNGAPRGQRSHTGFRSCSRPSTTRC